MKPTIFHQRLKQAMTTKLETTNWDVIAHQAGYSASYLQRLTYGHKSNPTIACVAALAETLDVNPSWLLGIDP